MDNSTNPFEDPAVVRVQAQQTAQTSEPKYTFGYNEPEPMPKPKAAPAKQVYYEPPPPPASGPNYKSASPQKPPIGDRTSNFPPIPPSWTWCPIKPCFYFNINEEIPADQQNLVRYQYYFMLGYFGIFVLNLIGSIPYIILGYPSKVMHLLMALLLSPVFFFLIFLLQFYLLYRAVKNDSSNVYFWYLIDTVAVTIYLLVDIIGPGGSGWCGLMIVAFSFDNENGSIFMGILSLIISFGLMAVLAKFLHTAYHCRLFYMIAKHRQLSNAITARQGGMSYTVTVPVS